MIQHQLFPTIISQTEIKHTATQKDVFMSASMDHFNEWGFTNESTGAVDLHLDTGFEPLYTAISRKVEKHLEALMIDLENVRVQITKSWFNIVEEQHTPLHTHSEAHFSFSFYLNIPVHYSQMIEFHCLGKHPTEPYTGFLSSTVKSWNKSNALSYAFTPTEGSLFIFPSGLNHKTMGDGVEGSYLESGVFEKDTLYNKRVCIAGDIILTHKVKDSGYAGLQPIENWRSF